LIPSEKPNSEWSAVQQLSEACYQRLEFLTNVEKSASQVLDSLNTSAFEELRFNPNSASTEPEPFPRANESTTGD
jgi:hypothetical protein